MNSIFLRGVYEMSKISFDIKNFANNIISNCDKAQIKEFDKNEIITTYIVNRNMIFILLDRKC